MTGLVLNEATLAEEDSQSHCLLPCRKDVPASEALRVLLLLVKQGANGLNLTGEACCQVHLTRLLQWAENGLMV